jgi:hypothetical protein
LLCSVAVCCPAMTVAGALLAVRALIEIKADSRIRGRGLAITGLAVGATSMIAWIILAMWWHWNARVPMMDGPAEPLGAGIRGDVAAFQAAFHDQAKSSVNEATSFLNELKARYGLLLDTSQRESAPDPAPLTGGPSAIRAPYVFKFERQSVDAEAAFVTFAPARVIPKPVFKWQWLRIIDPQRGDLIYPVASNGAIGAQPGSSGAATRP